MLYSNAIETGLSFGFAGPARLMSFNQYMVCNGHMTVPESPPKIATQPNRPNLRATSLGVSPAEFTILTGDGNR